MAQAPIQVDGINISPASGSGLAIGMDPTSGSMTFQDAIVTSPVFLSQLAGLGTIPGVLIVGKSGAGATYDNIQSALNAVPITSSPTSPYLILVMPGTYTENLTITKNGVFMVGFGSAIIQPFSSGPTITLQSSVSSSPGLFIMDGFRVGQTTTGQPCIQINGGVGSVVGSVGIYIKNCSLSPSGIGCPVVSADTINNVYLYNCSCSGSGSFLGLNQYASLTATNCVLPSLQLSYNSSSPKPSVVTTSTYIGNCQSVGSTLVNFSGAGSLTVNDCTAVGDMTFNGDQVCNISNSTVSSLAINNTFTVNSYNSEIGSEAGAGFFNPDKISGLTGFSTSSIQAVSFAVQRSSSVFNVFYDAGVPQIPYTTLKTASGFTINFPISVSTNVGWTVSK